MPDRVSLGGNIELVGFSEVDGGSMIILKKIIGSYSRKLSDRFKDFQKLVLTLEAVGLELTVHGRLVVGEREHQASFSDRNIFIAVDTALKELDKKIEAASSS